MDITIHPFFNLLLKTSQALLQQQQQQQRIQFSFSGHCEKGICKLWKKNSIKSISYIKFYGQGKKDFLNHIMTALLVGKKKAL